MSKIRLDVDTLHVETFEPGPQDGVLRGTVRAHGASDLQPCVATETRALQINTCVETYRTCYRTCFGCEVIDPSYACPSPTEDAGVNTCGLSCVRLCQPAPVTVQYVVCTAG